MLVCLGNQDLRFALAGLAVQGLSAPVGIRGAYGKSRVVPLKLHLQLKILVLQARQQGICLLFREIAVGQLGQCLGEVL